MNTYMIGAICAFAGFMTGTYLGERRVSGGPREVVRTEVKTETKEVNKYFSTSDRWYENGSDTILDGAARVNTFTIKGGRVLTVRCIKVSASSTPKFDVRYEISTPLLKRITPELQKATNIEVALAVDNAPATLHKARTGFQHDGLWFLFDVDRDLINKLAVAKKITAAPRQGLEKIDTEVEFGAVELAKHLVPIINACEPPPPEQPAPPPATKKD